LAGGGLSILCRLLLPRSSSTIPPLFVPPPAERTSCASAPLSYLKLSPSPDPNFIALYREPNLRAILALQLAGREYYQILDGTL